MKSALQYIGVDRNNIRELCAFLRELITVSESLYTKACKSDHRSNNDAFSAPAPQLGRLELPEFLKRSLRVLSIHAGGELRAERPHGSRDRLANELSKDLALLRHATDFIEDLAQCTASNEAQHASPSLFELFPACEREDDQLFWRSHQDQVCQALCTELSYPAFDTRINYAFLKGYFRYPERWLAALNWRRRSKKH